jgi:hypothetical protein
MTSYTVRDTATMHPVTSADTLDDAVARLQTERLAFLLNPPPDLDVLELVITADEVPGRQPGDILVRYAAGPQCGGRRPHLADPPDTH